MSDWYLGPLGELRPLVVPEPDISINQVRFGGVHQGLSGARTLDITGHRIEYTFEFRNLDRDEFMWLEALHTRFFPGPYHLIDPLKKNRLSAQASRLLLVDADSNGVYTAASAVSGSRDFPDTVNLPGRSLIVETADMDVVQFDSGKRIPLLTGETPLCSVYLKSEVPHEAAYLRASWYDIEDAFISNTDIDIDTSVTWSRHWYNFVDRPGNAYGVTFSVVLLSNAIPVWFAAPQVETSTYLPTDWEIGGGAPIVLIDQMPAVSGRFPLRHATLTLLEA